MSAREELERRLAALIAEHVEIGYTLRPDGLVDPDTIKITGATGAASVAIAAYEATLGIGEGGENVVVPTALMQALDERDLFLNPELLDQAAGAIDCDGLCEHAWREYDTNAAGCHAAERGDYCPNDVAETLRALAKVSRAMLAAEEDKP